MAGLEEGDDPIVGRSSAGPVRPGGLGRAGCGSSERGMDCG
jgi:hypothetical protein